MGLKFRKLNRRVNSKKGKPSPKVSSIKLGNKRTNQLIKKKAIKPKSKFISTFMKSQSKQRQQSVIDVNNSNEFDIKDVMDMLDTKDVQRIRKDGKSVGKRNKRPKWALDEDKDSDSDVDQIEEYERKPRKDVFKEVNVENDNKKIVNNQNQNRVEENEDNLKSETNNNQNNNESYFQSKSLVELFAERSVKLDELKTRIANLSTSIIAHPEINVKKLRDLLSLFDIKSDDKEYGLIFLSIQKMVALAALEVFRDIIPNYRVKEKINEEEDDKNSKKRNFRLKKETKRLREYEKSLIQLYRLYLLRLERMVQCVNRGKSQKSSNFYDQMLTSTKAKQRIATIGVKCFSELVITHPHFNFRTQIIETLVPLMANNKHKQISDICCETISKLYKSDKLGEISLEAVKCTSKLIKKRKFKINPKVLNTFLSLRIKEVKQRDDNKDKDMKTIRTKLNLMSRKERKRNKRMQKLDNQLLEAEATESKQRKLGFHTEILNQIFVTYFRILKNEITNIDSEGNQKWFKAILSPVLEGLSKFAHLINIEFFDDLIQLLYGLIRDKRLDDHQCLHCLQTVFTILSGEGSALNIDFQRFYSELYVILLNIDTNTGNDDIRILLSCLNTMIIKRKKQMTHNRVLAFIKRLSTISLQTVRQPSIAIMSVIRQIMINHRQSDILIDSEGSSIGSGIFLPEVEDPEHCNANATLLWELGFLNKHYEPIVRQFASHFLNSSKGNELPLITIKRRPLDLFNELVAEYNEFEFFLKNSKTTLKKSRNKYSIVDSQSSLASKCIQFLQKSDN